LDSILFQSFFYSMIINTSMIYVSTCQ